MQEKRGRAPSEPRRAAPTAPTQPRAATTAPRANDATPANAPANHDAGRPEADRARAAARRDRPPRAAPPAAAHDGNGAPDGTHTKPPANGPPSTGAQPPRPSDGNNELSHPQQKTTTATPAGTAARAAPSDPTERGEARNQHPTATGHTARAQRRARANRQALPQRNRRTAAGPPDGRRTGLHRREHTGDRGARPEPRRLARRHDRLPDAEDGDARRRATPDESREGQRIPTRGATDRERRHTGRDARADDAPHRRDPRNPRASENHQSRRQRTQHTSERKERRDRPNPRRPPERRHRRARPSHRRAQGDAAATPLRTVRGRSQAAPEPASRRAVSGAAPADGGIRAEGPPPGALWQNEEGRWREGSWGGAADRSPAPAP